MIVLPGDFPAWLPLVATPVAIFSGITLGGLAIAGGIAAGAAAAARHIQGFIEGHPWWEDPLENFKQDAIAFGTGAATAGIGAGIGNAVGSVASGAGAAAGPSAAIGQSVPRALVQAGMQGVGSGALGAARAALSGEDPLRGGIVGAAGSLGSSVASGLGRAAVGGMGYEFPQNVGGGMTEQNIGAPQGPIGTALSNAPNLVPSTMGRAGGAFSRAGVADLTEPKPPELLPGPYEDRNLMLRRWG